MQVPDQQHASPAPADVTHAAAASAPPLGAARRPGPVALALQIIGFLAGLAILAWILREAREEVTPRILIQILTASPPTLALIAMLAAVSVGLMGLTWWISIAPVRRLPLADCVAVNAVANSLALLPGKLSVLFRVALHRGRDGVPLLMFGGWAAAIAAVMAASILPPVLAALVLPSDSWAWWAASLAGSTLALALLILAARTFSTGRGWLALTGFIERRLGQRGTRITRSRALAHAHAGVFMLADPRWTIAGGLVRLADAAAFAARFYLAGSIVDVHLTAGQAAVVGVSYFLISLLVPTGSAGPREAGALAVLTRLGLPGETLVIVALVGVIELAVAIILGPLGALFLRLRGPLFRASGRHPGTTQPPGHPAPRLS